ncbi:orotidine 5'-phosphate decarboxylase / HUMPS family protein [Ammoniphilus sp. 3BR4]|uniref:orotidine 5'-phosphate decarboxylase / HUMPS family protein n=1 Tax=Ammoniphilus sp. 3BR4 TaxID=3158265 RepID=UPI003465DBC7
MAHKYQKSIMIDLLGINDSKRIEELDRLGVDLVSLHIGKDSQKEKAFDTSHFALVRPFPHMEVTVAGGINLETFPDIIKEHPQVLIVGSAITGAADPKGVSSLMKKQIIQSTKG